MSDDPHAALRDDVRMLGRMLGDQLRTLAGAEVFDAVERIRELAKEARASGDPGAHAWQQLDAVLASLPDERAAEIARGFSHFLTLANIAEQHHRGRRRRAQRERGQHGSLALVLPMLLQSGIDPATLVETIASLRIELVLTAHPTEVMRRTMLIKERRIEALLGEHDRPGLDERERAEVVAALKREVAAFWATDEFRPKRPTPEQEARGGFAVIEHVLWDAIPAIVRELDDRTFALTGQRLPAEIAPIRFGSWMGGDRDGNPNVTAEVTRRVILLARWAAADLYAREIAALRDELSMNHASDELRAEIGEAWEPYRALLRRVERRLLATRAWSERALEGGRAELSPDADAYVDADELARALRLCHRSLHECGLGEIADGRLLDTMRRVACFGVTLVALDLRQDSSRHTEALDEITRSLGLGGYADWDEAMRCEFLMRELDGRRPLLPRDFTPSERVREVLDTFAVAAAAPASSLGAYVISMCHAPSDVLAVELLQREAGNPRPQRVVPLFETVEDLDRAGASMRALLAIATYRERTGARQEVMIGYSDSAKRAGRLAAAWSLYRAQEDVVAAAREHGVELTLFHGRGGSVGRGGGNTYEAVLSQPPGAVPGRLRVTEQGEVIHAKLGFPEVALRSLEVYLSATLQATLRPPIDPEPSWRRCMDMLARSSRRAYEEVVVDDPRFVRYFRQATPEAELSRMNIGSRPARRGGSEGGLDSLRAIPWVFAWTQTRSMLPAWLGVGEALDDALAQGCEPELRTMVERWPFFGSTLAMIAMVLAKASPEIARRYDERLVEPELRDVGTQILARLARTELAVKRVLGRELLADNPVLERSIAVRNPYVDPLNLLQVEYLRRTREREDPALVRGLLITINGVVAGMRNTG
ncbi:MAG TPA: phosphoenolpyruvate carboxylase [Nannocystaceae bacterium]|nr:phosphoenolpyruvate carboxylase [Nannocystaceae bacterium]